MTLLHPRESALLHYAAGSAVESVRRRVANHLASCERCRRVVVSTRELRATLAGAGELAASDALFTRILSSRAAGERVLLPVEAPADTGANRVARPALWIALAGAAAIAIVSVVPKVWVPSAASNGAAKATAVEHPLSPELDPTIPAAGPIDPARMHEVTLRYGMVELPGGSPDPGVSISYRFVRSGMVGSDWILITEYHQAGIKRRPDSIWIDAATLEPTRWRANSNPGMVVYTQRDGALRATRTLQPIESAARRARYGPSDTSYQMPALELPIAQNQAHFIALMMTMPLAKQWGGRFARLAVERTGVTAPPYEGLRITGSRTVITGAGKFDCWEAAVRRPDGYWLRWFRKSDGLYVGEEAVMTGPSVSLGEPRYHFKVLLVSEE